MTITVGVDTYVTVAESNTFLAQSIRAFSVWSGIDDETKEAALVSATRELQILRWVGTITSIAQALAWPRTGAVDREGTPIDSSTVPQDVKNAQMDWAFVLSQDSSLEGAGIDGYARNDKSYRAGSVAIEFFKPFEGTIAPPSVMRHIAHLLRGSTGLAGAMAFGTDVVPRLDGCYGHLRDGVA